MTATEWERFADCLRAAVEAEGLRATVTAEASGVRVEVIGGTRTDHDDTEPRVYRFGHGIGGATGGSIGFQTDWALDEEGLLPWATYPGWLEDDWGPSLADWLIAFMA